MKLLMYICIEVICLIVGAPALIVGELDILMAVTGIALIVTLAYISYLNTLEEFED